MKKITLIIALMLPALYLAAQTTQTTDTTFRYNDKNVVIKENNKELNVSVYRQNAQGDTIKSERIYEGVFTEHKEIERHYESNFEITIPGIFNPKNKQRKNTAHWSGIGFGRPYFSDDLHDAFRITRSTQWNINLVQTSLNLWNSGLTFMGGVGYQINNVQMQPNTIIRNIDNVSVISPTNADEKYSKAKLQYSYFTFSLLLEGNIRLNHRNRLFINGGIVSKLNTTSQLNAWENNKKIRLTRDINIAEGADFIFQTGVNNVGLFVTRSLYPLFEYDKGPKGNQTTIGFQLYF